LAVVLVGVALVEEGMPALGSQSSLVEEEILKGALEDELSVAEVEDGPILVLLGSANKLVEKGRTIPACSTMVGR
jgi:hypothetical protein